MKRPRSRPLWLRMLGWSLLIGLTLGAAGVGVGLGLLWHYGQDLPTIDRVQDYSPKQVSRVYAASGELLVTWTDDDAIYRTLIEFDEIAPVMRTAIIAAEDSEFYNHAGLDYIGLVRAIVTNIRRGQLSQGASTITQQVVKNLVLSPERTIRRKVQEALLSFRLEDRLTKDEILAIYLNQVFFGSRYYGVEEAARYYFGVSASELTLPQAALMAGLVQSPNRYNPFFHPEAALRRRGYVLRQMYEKGFIDEPSYRDADAAELVLDPNRGVEPFEGSFPYYVDAVRRELLSMFTPEQVFAGGLRVTAAVEIEAQLIAEETVRNGLHAFDARRGFHTPFARPAGAEGAAQWRAQNSGEVETLGLRAGREYRAVIVEHTDERTVVGIGPYVAKLAREPLSRVRPDDRGWDELFPVHSVFTVTPRGSIPVDRLSEVDPESAIVDLLPSAEAALVAIDPDDRRVVALVGGYVFGRSAFNRAVQARRQVGSAFKPVVFGAALDARALTPATVMLDQPVTFPLHAGRTWQPQNYDGQFLGPMTLRTALARSRNVIAVRVLDVIGLPTAHTFARDLGIEAELTDNLTLALGSAELTPLEMTNAFATFAADGVRARPVLVLRVEDGRGTALFEATSDAEQTVDPAVAWLTTSMMRSVIERGTGGAARSIGRPLVGKTGTTNGARDAWFIGYSTDVVVGVWVGRDNNAELGRGETGGQTALPLWIEFIERTHRGRDVTDFGPPPPGIVAARVDESTGLLARPGAAGYDEYFLEGTLPASFAPDTSDRSIQQILLDGGGRQTEGGEPPPTSDDDGF